MQPNINGIDTRYVISNEGDGPWLTFIHQLGGDLSVWDQLAGYFRDDFTVLRYDSAATARRQYPTSRSRSPICPAIWQRCSTRWAQRIRISSACRWAA